LDAPERPAARRGEGAAGLGMHFLRLGGRENRFVEHNQRALVAGGVGRGNPNRRREIEHAIIADHCGSAHRAGEDHRLDRVDRQIDQVCAFFKRIGAVGHHYAVDLGCEQRRLDALPKLKRVCRRQVAARQVGKFLECQLDARARQLRQKILTFEHRNGAADHRAIAHHGDRAASGDDHDFLQGSIPLI
jgi:hypothetical protein